MNNKLILGLATIITLAVLIYFLVKIVIPKEEEDPVAVNCGNNKVVYRYRDPSKAFPVVTREYDLAFTAASDILNRISDSATSLSLDIEAQNSVKQLQEKLNQDNITFFTALRSYFISCNSNPCNDTLQAKYMVFVDEMSKRMLELRRFIETTSVTGGQDTTHVAYDPNALKLDKKLDAAIFNKAVHNLDLYMEKKNLPVRALPVPLQPMHQLPTVAQDS